MKRYRVKFTYAAYQDGFAEIEAESLDKARESADEMRPNNPLIKWDSDDGLGGIELVWVKELDEQKQTQNS